MATCAHNPAHVSKPKQKALVGGKGEWANIPCSFLVDSPIHIGNIKSPILFGNIKSQFSLATSKPNSH